MKKVSLYIAGKYSSFRGKGTCAYTLVYGSHKKSKVYDPSTFEYDIVSTVSVLLVAVLDGLKMLKEPCEVTICTDNIIVINSLSYLGYYERNGWKTKKNTDFKYKGICEQIAKVSKRHILTFKDYLDKTTEKLVDDEVERLFRESRGSGSSHSYVGRRRRWW